MENRFQSHLPDAEARRVAVDPRYNVVLEASAGTGKTAVLVARYVNLLRAGVNPDHILAITFTRKAAAEMRERVVRELGRLAEKGELAAPRWAELRERLGEMALSTIDAFCLALLSEFPLEADLEPGVALVDEADLPPLRADAIERAIRRAVARARDDGELALVLSHLGLQHARAALFQLLGRRLVARGALERVVRRAPTAPSGEAAGRLALGQIVAAIETAPGGIAHFVATGPQDHPTFALLATILTRFPEPTLPGDAAWRHALDHIAAYFLTKSDKRPRERPSSVYRPHFPSEEARHRHLEAFRAVAPQVARILDQFGRGLNAILVRGLHRLFLLALDEYERLLDREGALDFDGALERALRLLRQMDEFAQSRYRLEARYRHVLVDEFQDTSRAQWELVWSLVEAWSAGLGVAADDGLEPTIFVVGDRKQSIYGFRDAEVGLLDQAAARIASLRPGDRPRRSIRWSFRAIPALLEFVNDLFSEIAAGSARPDAFRYDETDRFPVVRSAGADGSGAPAIGLIAAESVETCAERIAAEIVVLLQEGRIRDRHSGLEREVRPADIGILFRARESHRAFEEGLVARGVPAYVYKGLGFFDTDEVQDLTALIRFFADPTSELRAAAFLRSRFVRLSDAALASLAPRIARALLAPDEPLVSTNWNDEDRAVFSRVRAALPRWLGQVDRIPPADLLDAVLQESAYWWELRGPRARQARENVKKLRALVRRVQNRGYATMARLAARLDQLSLGDESNAIVDAADAVNLMTIHAAKGLEFPVVFVVNLERGTGGPASRVRLVLDGGDGEPLVGVENLLPDLPQVEMERAREETKRLLYVAMTRARDRLYLSAVLRQGKCVPGRGSLAEVLPSSFQRVLEAAATAPDGAVVGWTAASGRTHSFRVSAMAGGGDSTAWSRYPAEVRGRPVDLAPLLPGAVPRVSVSAAIERSAVAPERAAGEGADAVRSAPLVGRLVHRLVRRCGGALPGAGELARVAERCLRPEERVGGSDLDAVIRSACDVYTALCRRPEVMALFDGRCDYEVPFALWVDPDRERLPGDPPGPAILRGVVDCLVWKPDGRVVVVELKTGAPRPEHERQLDWYVRAVRAWLPGREVSGTIVYA